MTPTTLNPFDYPALIVLMAVLFLIAVRQVGRFRFQIWQVMLLGALAVLIMGSIRPVSALKAINLDVMLFLFGMFVVGEALNQSGYLYQLSYRVFGRSKSVDSLILSMLIGLGVLSAFLMNDTLAIICTPLVLYFARQ
ncbi:MAG TPA: SLC13 family permease, partial [Candidatus Acidoferrum sp.]|nr:SLC13 family permease [Candidatus Acidoferrum sp.]